MASNGSGQRCTRDRVITPRRVPVLRRESATVRFGAWRCADRSIPNASRSSRSSCSIVRERRDLRRRERRCAARAAPERPAAILAAARRNESDEHRSRRRRSSSTCAPTYTGAALDRRPRRSRRTRSTIAPEPLRAHASSRGPGKDITEFTHGRPHRGASSGGRTIDDLRSRRKRQAAARAATPGRSTSADPLVEQRLEAGFVEDRARRAARPWRASSPGSRPTTT